MPSALCEGAILPFWMPHMVSCRKKCENMTIVEMNLNYKFSEATKHFVSETINTL